VYVRKSSVRHGELDRWSRRNPALATGVGVGNTKLGAYLDGRVRAFAAAPHARGAAAGTLSCIGYGVGKKSKGTLRDLFFYRTATPAPSRCEPTKASASYDNHAHPPRRVRR
jgi:hypothetical protein